MSVQRARDLRKNQSAPEGLLWRALRSIKPVGYHFRRQVQLGPYYADFACHHARLVIEVDGDTHGSDTALDYDRTRDDFIRGQGYDIVRVLNHEVMHNLDGVMTFIIQELDGRPKSMDRALRRLRKP